MYLLCVSLSEPATSNNRQRDAKERKREIAEDKAFFRKNKLENISRTSNS